MLEIPEIEEKRVVFPGENRLRGSGPRGSR
jgi:hypothetical protein